VAGKVEEIESYIDEITAGNILMSGLWVPHKGEGEE
jgi:hypothetical protein